MPTAKRYTYLRDRLVPGAELLSRDEAIEAARRLAEIEQCQVFVLEAKEYYTFTPPKRAAKVKRGYLKNGSNIQEDNRTK